VVAGRAVQAGQALSPDAWLFGDGLLRRAAGRWQPGRCRCRCHRCRADRDRGAGHRAKRGAPAALGAWAPDLSDRKLTAQGLLTTASTETRIKHWHLAIEGWRQRPWLGWGPDSFQQLTVEEVCQWRKARGEGCERGLYLQQKHAHSLYAATLAERGIVGAVALLLLLALWGWSLVRSAGSAAQSWLWPASAAGFLIVLVAGTFNTTLRVEHGSLAVVFFGLWIAAHGRGSRPASRSA
jgi:O-antigen ligase